MRKTIRTLALAGVLVLIAAGATAKVTNLATCADTDVTQNAVACAGFVPKNVLDASSASLATQVTELGDIGFTFAGTTTAFNSATKIDNLNGATTINFGKPLDGVTYFAVHFGGGRGGPGNGTAFYKVDFTTPTNTITLNYQASSDAVLYSTGNPNGGVPEPATWAMMILGVGLAGGVLRRKGRAAIA